MTEQDTTYGLIAERIMAMASDPNVAKLYPTGVSFVAADNPESHELAARNYDSGTPTVIMFPTGEEVLIRPPLGRRVLGKLRQTRLRSLLHGKSQRRRSIAGYPVWRPAPGEYEERHAGVRQR